MAASQKTTCARPNLAATPTHADPTTHRIWARTKSVNPNSWRMCGFVSEGERLGARGGLDKCLNRMAQNFQNNYQLRLRTNQPIREPASALTAMAPRCQTMM